MNIFFRGILSADSAMLLRWRNDPETRKNSINTAEISPEQHAAWMHRVLVGDVREVEIALVGDIPVGVMRFDWDKENATADLSFTVAPEHRGNGYGSAMVAQVLKGVENMRLTGEVKISNAASRRIFDKHGFRVIDSQGELLMYAKDI